MDKFNKEDREERDENFEGDREDSRDSEKSDRKFSKTKFRADYPLSFKFDYKDPSSLSRFLFEGGKIVPARVSKLSFRQQKSLNSAVKRARHLALLPNGSLAYDDFKKASPISPKPFEY